MRDHWCVLSVCLLPHSHNNLPMQKLSSVQLCMRFLQFCTASLSIFMRALRAISLLLPHAHSLTTWFAHPSLLHFLTFVPCLMHFPPLTTRFIHQQNNHISFCIFSFSSTYSFFIFWEICRILLRFAFLPTSLGDIVYYLPNNRGCLSSWSSTCNIRILLLLSGSTIAAAASLFRRWLYW